MNARIWMFALVKLRIFPPFFNCFEKSQFSEKANFFPKFVFQVRYAHLSYTFLCFFIRIVVQEIFSAWKMTYTSYVSPLCCSTPLLAFYFLRTGQIPLPKNFPPYHQEKHVCELWRHHSSLSWGPEKLPLEPPKSHQSQQSKRWRWFLLYSSWHH